MPNSTSISLFVLQSMMQHVKSRENSTGEKTVFHIYPFDYSLGGRNFEKLLFSQSLCIRRHKTILPTGFHT